MDLGNPALPANMTRPQVTYKDMIIDALRRSPEKRLKLQEIYQVIQLLYPYYRSVPDNWAWQNSIRHNLSLHDCFVKEQIIGSKANHVHHWTLDEEKLASGERVRRRRRSMRMAPRNEDPGAPPFGDYPQLAQPSPVLSSIGSEEETSAPTGSDIHLASVPPAPQWVAGNIAPLVVPAADLLPNNPNVLEDLLNVIRDNPQFVSAFFIHLLGGNQHDQLPHN